MNQIIHKYYFLPTCSDFRTNLFETIYKTANISWEYVFSFYSILLFFVQKHYFHSSTTRRGFVEVFDELIGWTQDWGFKNCPKVVIVNVAFRRENILFFEAKKQKTSMDIKWKFYVNSVFLRSSSKWDIKVSLS